MGGGVLGDILDLEADLQAHRTPGVEHDGVPDDTAHRPAMPCDALLGGQARQPAATCVIVGRAMVAMSAPVSLDHRPVSNTNSMPSTNLSKKRQVMMNNFAARAPTRAVPLTTPQPQRPRATTGRRSPALQAAQPPGVPLPCKGQGHQIAFDKTGQGLVQRRGGGAPHLLHRNLLKMQRLIDNPNRPPPPSLLLSGTYCSGLPLHRLSKPSPPQSTTYDGPRKRTSHGRGHRRRNAPLQLIQVVQQGLRFFKIGLRFAAGLAERRLRERRLLSQWQRRGPTVAGECQPHGRRLPILRPHGRRGTCGAATHQKRRMA